MLSNLSNIITVEVEKNEKRKHITASAKNGWQVKRIDRHRTNKNMLLITYVKNN